MIGEEPNNFNKKQQGCALTLAKKPLKLLQLKVLL